MRFKVHNSSFSSAENDLKLSVTMIYANHFASNIFTVHKRKKMKIRDGNKFQIKLSTLPNKRKNLTLSLQKKLILKVLVNNFHLINKTEKTFILRKKVFQVVNNFYFIRIMLIKLSEQRVMRIHHFVTFPATAHITFANFFLNLTFDAKMSYFN
jgi:hypothetical protein